MKDTIYENSRDALANIRDITQDPLQIPNVITANSNIIIPIITTIDNIIVNLNDLTVAGNMKMILPVSPNTTMTSVLVMAFRLLA